MVLSGTSKGFRGLGVGNLLHRNSALRFRWWWRFSNEDAPLWKRIVASDYRIKGAIVSEDEFRNAMSGV